MPALVRGKKYFVHAMQNPLIYIDPEGLLAVVDDAAIVVTVVIGGAVVTVVCIPLECGKAIAEAIKNAAEVTSNAVNNTIAWCSSWFEDEEEESDEEREERCEENLERDIETCRALDKRGGKAAYRVCEQQAMLRYSNCLAGRDDGAPLPPWGNTY